MLAVIDTKAALQRVDGDVQFLRELLDLFVDEAPQVMADIRAAIACHDAEALARAAHSLKGAAANLAATAAAEAALRLEHMGRAGDLSESPRACDTLEAEIARVREVLATLA